MRKLSTISRYLFLLGAVVGLGLVVASNLNQDSSYERHSRPSVLNRGLVGEPETLDPLNFRSVQAEKVLRDIGEGLLTYSQYGDLVGGVAESWTVSSDGLEYTFRLRSNARWSNGDSVVAANFVHAFRQLVTPSAAAANASFVEQVYMAPQILRGEAAPDELGVFAPSDLELVIKLHTPIPYYLQLLTHPSTFPKYSRPNTTDYQSESVAFQTVSNGAYKLDDWIVGSEISLSRNENYWDSENIFFDLVAYHVVQELTELNRYRAGDLDITENVPSSMFEHVIREFGSELHVSPYLGVYYYGFNVSKSIFKGKPKLRRALSLAVNRETLVTKITGRGEEPAYSWVPPGVYNYDSQPMPESEYTQKERADLARQLYQEAGYGEGKQLHVELRYNTSDVQRRIALAVQAMWHDTLGADVTLINEEFKVLLSNIREGDITEVFRLSWTGDYNDAHTFLQLFKSNSPSNMTGYSNFTYDQLMYRIEREPDNDKRQELMRQAEALVVAEHVVIPLYFYVSKHLVHPRIAGWSNNILDIHPSRYLAVHEM